MFHIYGVAGRVPTRSPELPGRVPPAAAVLRARPADPIGQGHEVVPEATHSERGDRDAAAAALRSVYGDKPAAAHTRPALVCGDLMVKATAVLTEDTRLPEAWDLLLGRGFGHAWVLGPGRQLSGVLLREDLHAVDPFEFVRGPQDRESLVRLARRVAEQWLSWQQQPVRSFMRTPLPGLLPTSPLRQAAVLLLSSQLPLLPVVDAQGHPIGELGPAQILRAVANDPPIDLWT